MLTHGSLFSGIEGFTEGANRAKEIDTLFHVEKNKFCNQVIKKLNPNGTQYYDIFDFDGSPWANRIDILSGGFPCQNISNAAGKSMAGILGKKSSLWFQFARAIEKINPRYVIIENSHHLTIRGLEVVLCDLSRFGYDAEWETISCAAFGMPHERKRVFIIAYSNDKGWEKPLQSYKGSIFKSFEPQKCKELDSQSNCFLQFQQMYGQPPIWRIYDGVRTPTYTRQRLEAIGNSVSPVIAEYLFHCIKYHYSELNPSLCKTHLKQKSPRLAIGSK